MLVASAQEVAVETDQVFASEALRLVNPLVYTHLAAPWDRVHRRLLLNDTAARSIEAPPVRLIRYPTGTLVDGDGSYLLLARDCLVREQIAPGIIEPAINAQWMVAEAPNAVEISQPCLIVARYGEITWGHWVAEILVKAAIAERVYPGRFQFAVPACVTGTTGNRSYSTTVLESLAAYGISSARLIRLQPKAVYRFHSLYDISGIVSDGMHPRALESLRVVSAPVPAGPSHRKIASLRRKPEPRAIFNSSAVESLLTRRDFVTLSLAELPYLEQVAAFRDAEVVVGSMGSNLTGLIFARQEVGVVTLGPAAWRDGYFTQILQRRRAFHADLRGPSTQMENADPAQSPHFIDPRRLADALAAVTRRPSRIEVVVDGETMPRELGPIVLKLSFGTRGNATTFATDGWAAPEYRHTWSIGPACSIAIPAGAIPPANTWLVIEGIGHVVEPYMPVRPFSVFLNGTPIGNFDVCGRVRLHCKLPLEAAARQPLVLSFDHQLHPSPRSMGSGKDDRQLGFGFESLTFHSVLN